MTRTKTKFTALILTLFMIFALVPATTLPTTAYSPSSYPTPMGYNDNDYQKLVAFALQDDNLTKLGWDLNDPASWSGIGWGTGGGDTARVQIIFLRNRNLTGTLDVSNFTALFELSCQENQLTALDASGCTALEGLYANNNRLAELNVSGCTALRWLYAAWGDNRITELDVTSSTELEELDLGHSLLTELDVRNNPKLVRLGLTGNLLTELDLKNNLKLMRLNLGWGNSLTELDVSNNPELQILNLGWGNRLTKLDVSNNPELQILDLSENQLTELDVSKNTKLTSLDLINNRLSELILTNNTALTHLALQENQLKELDVSELTELRALNCGFNQLTELDVSNNIALEELSLYGNFLTELDLSGLNAIVNLNFAGNLITEIDVSGLPDLDYFDCNTNFLTELNLSKNPKITYLLARDNLLTDISFLYDLPLLCAADVSNNLIDLNDPVIKAEIIKIQATIDANKLNPPVGYPKDYGWYENGAFHHGFIYEPQKERSHENIIDDSLFEDALNDENPRIVLDGDTGSVISEDALEMIRDSEKVVEIELENGLIITIDPEKITEEARAIDLNIDVTITSQGNQVIGVPANSVVINPAAHGEFGFELSLTITAKQLSDAGLNGNNVKLFYIDADGKVEEMGMVKLNPDGSITFGITRASFYVLSEVTPGDFEPIDITIAGGNPLGAKAVLIAIGMLTTVNGSFAAGEWSAENLTLIINQIEIKPGQHTTTDAREFINAIIREIN